MRYRIRQTSIGLFFISLMGTIFCGLGIVVFIGVNELLPKDQSWIPILIIIPFTYFGFIIPRYTATVDIELTLDQNGLKKKWLKQFLFHNQPDIEIGWTEIEDFVFEPDRYFDKFKLTLKDGSKFRFFHYNEYNDKDDFLDFIDHFDTRVKRLNSDKNNANDIKRGKTIYETNWGLFLAGLAILLLIAIPIMLIAFPTKKSVNYGYLGAAYVGAIFYLYQVYSYRRQNKDDR